MTKSEKRAPWKLRGGECLCHLKTGIAFRLLDEAGKAPDGTYGYQAVTMSGRKCFIPLSDIVFGSFVRIRLSEEEDAGL